MAELEDVSEVDSKDLPEPVTSILDNDVILNELRHLISARWMKILIICVMIYVIFFYLYG